MCACVPVHPRECPNVCVHVMVKTKPDTEHDARSQCSSQGDTQPSGARGQELGIAAGEGRPFRKASLGTCPERRARSWNRGTETLLPEGASGGLGG